MNRRQFLKTTALSLFATQAMADSQCVGTPQFETPKYSIIASYNKTQKFSLEYFALNNSKFGECLIVHHNEVARFPINIVDDNLRFPGSKPFENNDFFVVEDISNYLQLVKESNKHMMKNQDFHVIKDSYNFLTWNNNG